MVFLRELCNIKRGNVKSGQKIVLYDQFCGLRYK